MCRSKHVETLKNFGIINSITKLHLVGISTDHPSSSGGWAGPPANISEDGNKRFGGWAGPPANISEDGNKRFPHSAGTSLSNYTLHPKRPYL